MTSTPTRMNPDVRRALQRVAITEYLVRDVAADGCGVVFASLCTADAIPMANRTEVGRAAVADYRAACKILAEVTS